MLLTDEEKRMQAGDYGPGIRRAIDFLIKLGVLPRLDEGDAAAAGCTNGFISCLVNKIGYTITHTSQNTGCLAPLYNCRNVVLLGNLPPHVE